MKSNENLKRNKGITLIALVVTIIVLLILAGISISILAGNNGILNKAVTAKEKTSESQALEKAKLALSNYTIDKNVENKNNVKEVLDKSLGSANVKNFSSNSKVATFEYKGKKIKYDLENNAMVEDTPYEIWDGTETKSTGLVGEGTDENPYLIKNADDLLYFNKILCEYGKITGLNSDNTENSANISAQNASIKLTSNISLNNKKWSPLGKISGTNVSSFYGKFDGNGYEITEINEEEESGSVGFFVNLESNSEIKNLRITNSTFIQKGSSRVGGIAATSYNAKIEDCYFSGTITTSGTETGGIVGYMYSGSIKNCISEAQIKSTNSYVGGIIGNGYNVNVENATNDGSITGGQHIGGIAGNLSGTMKKCNNKGSISSNDQHVGGLIGSVEGPGEEIEDCNNLGEINITGTAYDCGGLVGVIQGGDNNKITNSYNKANINGNIKYGGGIIGYSYKKVTVIKCENTGEFNGTVEIKGDICANSDAIN